MTSRVTPLHSVAPRHIAHGSQLVTSSCAGRPGERSVNDPTRCCANISATISACRTQFEASTTRLTPAATTFPEPISNTAAPKGPPAPRATFSPANRMTSAILSWSSRKARPATAASPTHAGTSMMRRARSAVTVGGR